MASREDAVFPIFPNNGISKREHFAGEAMQGLLAANRALTSTEIAEMAVEQADALIAALAKVRP